MNKKFLSVILFSALMVGTAGTFTSCKDYDDDIDQINKELTDIKSQIAALQTKIDNGDYVTGISKTADGKGMTFTFSKGSPVTVTLDVKDGANGEPGAPGKDAQQVTVDEKTGELKIDGEGTGIFPAKDAAKAPVMEKDGYWYTLDEEGEYKNTNIPVSGISVTGSDLAGYTLTIYDVDGKKVIKLPTAASSLSSVTVVGKLFTEWASIPLTVEKDKGIKWGVASKAIDWKGPKGNIAKDQLLIGQISTQDVEVLPATYLLSEQVLSLVASDGSVAPVTVTATAETKENAETSDTRAVKSGKWTLSVTPNETVSGDNMGSAFATNNKNLKYALAVNSNIMTGYQFVIDTQTNTEAEGNVKITAKTSDLYLGAAVISNTNKLKVGENTLAYKNAMVYDAYLSFEGTNIALAKVLGVEVDGMTVKVPASAANTSEKLEVTVHVMDVTGAESTAKQLLYFGTSQISDVDVIAETTYKVMPTNRKAIVINLGDVLASMSDADAEKVKDGKQLSIAVKDDKQSEFIYAINPSYAKALMADGVTVDKSYDATTDDVRDLKYITIATSGINTNAKAGKYTLVLTIKDAVAGNEIKKVEMPIAITLPAFDELFEKSAAWNGNVVTMNLNNSGFADFTTAYKYDLDNLTDMMEVVFDKINNNIVAVWNVNGQVQIQPALVANGAAKDATAETQLTIGGKLVVKSGKYTMHFVAPLNGAALTYYKDGAASEVTIDGADGNIAAYTAASGSTKAAGLALVLKNKAYALNAIVNTVDLTTAEIDFKFDAKAGAKAKASINDGVLSITELAAGSYTTTLTVTITDGNKIKTVVTLPIKVNN